MSGQTALKWIEDNTPRLISLSDEVWRLAEVGLHELKSAELQAKALAAAGFSIEQPVAHMPAAFVATWGSGAPVIALLGEYDALPGTSQKPVPHPEPYQPGAPGHACGHNLLGVAALGAAIAAKAEMERRGIKGTVKYMGCPAEENAGGKVYMVRDGCFDGVDVALTWHPSAVNAVRLNSSLANHQAKFRFTGRTAHAAGNPEMGRSALDAVELMNIGVNYLREHVIQEARIHYVTTSGGGEPNVVPGVAESWYYIRAPRMSQVKELYTRIMRIAEGACLMTDTKLQVIFPGVCASVVPNQPLAEALHRNMVRAGAPDFGPEDFEFAREMIKHFPEGQYEASVRRMVQMGLDLAGEVLHRSVAPLSLDRTAMPGSTDVGDVSWVTPTAQFGTACFVLGSSGHSWQITASSGMSIGHKGMLQAAKVLALTTLEVLEDADLRAKAKAEFAREKGGEEYECMIPSHVVEPPDPFASSKH